MHIVQAPRIGSVAPHCHSAIEGRPLGGSIVGKVSNEVCVLAAEPITESRGRRGAGTARVLPLRLGRQLVRPSGRQPARTTLAFGQSPAELVRLLRAHEIHWMVRTFATY